VKITTLQSENFKRLKAVRIETGDANTVVIGGRNAQGKSSVLDSIMAALAGKRGTKEITRPIRDGESKATVVLELGDLRVERKWTKSGSTVTVGPKDGAAKFNSPQAVLDKLIGALAFDPLEFAEAEPRKQVETLIDIVGREAFDAIAAERKSMYDNRTDMNREAKSLKAQVDGLGDDIPRVGEPPAVDVQALSEEYGVAKEKIALRERWERLRAEMDEIEQRGHALPPSRPVEQVNADLSDAVRKQDVRQRWEQRQSLLGRLEGCEEVARKHTEAIEKLDADKAAHPRGGAADRGSGLRRRGRHLQRRAVYTGQRGRAPQGLGRHGDGHEPRPPRHLHPRRQPARR
jgi:DNA repair exonuclease SbcCD ATPase subunit